MSIEYETKREEKIRQNFRKIFMIVSGIFSIAGFILSIYFIIGMAVQISDDEIKNNLISLIFLVFVLICWVVSVFFYSYLFRQKSKEEIDIKKLIDTRGWT